MATGWNGSGTVVLTDGTYTSTWCQSQAGDGDDTIYASELDALFQCIEDSIQSCLPHDGQKAATDNIPMGGNRLTGLGTPSASSDAALHGDVIASGVVSGTDIVFTQNDSTTITVDASTLAAGTGGVALTGDQTVAGVKTFSGDTVLSGANYSGPTMSVVDVPTPGASVTVDATASDRHYVTVGTNTNVTFTWPTAAADTELGSNWMISGSVLFRHTGAGYTITLNSTMLSALDYYEEEGSEATGSGDLSTLVYTYYYINGTKLAQFAWVSTP